jgi:hypothetical protein
MSKTNIDSLLGYMHLALGGAFVLKGIALLRTQSNGLLELGIGRSLGQGPEAAAMAKAGGVITNVKSVPVRDIAERVSYIQERIKEDSLKPEVKEKSLAVLTRKCGTKGSLRWCVEPKNYIEEIKALYRAVQDANSDVALRYTRDHIEVDQFTAADKLIRLKGGDCDDGTILLGAMLRSVGYPVKLRVIQDTKSPTWSHIYLLVGVPPQRPSKWVPLDWSVYPFKPAGWQAPGAAEYVLSGQPSGMVQRLRDFQV